MSKVKAAIADARADYALPITKVTFVAIFGGKEGAHLERGELGKLGGVLDDRARIEDLVDSFVDELFCCISCGIRECGCVPGWDSAVHMWALAGKRCVFCTPIKSQRMRYICVAPSDLEAYIIDPSIDSLQEFHSPKMTEQDSAFEVTPVTQFHPVSQ